MPFPIKSGSNHPVVDDIPMHRGIGIHLRFAATRPAFERSVQIGCLKFDASRKPVAVDSPSLPLPSFVLTPLLLPAAD